VQKHSFNALGYYLARSRMAFFCLFSVCSVLSVVNSSSSASEAEFFEKRVRPVLVEQCVRCHGPKKQSGGLRLDSRAALFRGGDNGPVIQPSKPDKSLLIQAIRRDGEVKMPPKTPLGPQAVADLTEWVKRGATWPEERRAKPTTEEVRRHWALQPSQDPPAPMVRRRDWLRNSIDRFILARLEERGLTPSAPADRRTLLRRVTFDLIGLPPSPEEIAAFEADRSPDAYAKVIDRLLTSPHYGERWGRYWLDVARYADTKGYVLFEEEAYPWAWTYRDYVNRAFNEDLPYDRFIIEQLAADQLPLGPDRRPLTAMGFLTLGGHFLSNPHDIIDDRIDVVTRGLLGLTVTCARCHDHKFDPIPAKDYYALYGIFASSVEPIEPPLFEQPPKTPAYESFRKELEKREKALADFVRDKYEKVIESAKTRVADYLLAARELRDQPRTDDFMLIADGNDLNPAILSRWQAYLLQSRKKHDPVLIPWHLFAALPDNDFAEKSRELCRQLSTGTVPGGAANPLVVKAFADKPPHNLKEAAHRYGELLNSTEKAWRQIVRNAESAHSSPPGSLPEPAREELRQVFHGPGSPPNLPMSLFSELDLIPDRPSQDQLQKLRKEVEKWRIEGPGAPPRAHVLVDAPTPYEPCVFLRGNPNNRGEAVRRQFLSAIAGARPRPFRNGSGRLELARAIAARDNPLTARVLVNRVWQHHFGKGLVGTPSDFGLRSDPPTHPELLDHLATTFMNSGWSIKKLHRLILLSATYQQKSDDRLDCRRLDAENALLWRMNRRRLDLEAMRDALLAVSGRLDRARGGPPVKDMQGSSGRRTVYGFLDRLHVPGLFRTFDFPSPDASSPQRDATTIPQQALFLMNNPFVLECARALVQLPEIAAENDCARRVDRLYRRLYGRGATADEVSLAREFTGGEMETLRWVRYVQGLLMTNEFAFVD
jgi:hypothetical protein